MVSSQIWVLVESKKSIERANMSIKGENQSNYITKKRKIVKKKKKKEKISKKGEKRLGKKVGLSLKK